MTSQSNWREIAAEVIYEAYPDSDLLPIEPPRPGETISDFSVRAEQAGDTLFLFLCREADEEIDTPEYLARLARAIGDIEWVRDAFVNEPAATNEAAGETARPDVTIRLWLGNDWIELGLSYADPRGRRSGTIRSSLHVPEKDDRYNAVVDAVESIVLAHACAGIDVDDPRYVEGIRTCVAACADRL